MSNRAERMRYQKNKLSSSLSLFSIAVNAAYFVMLYGNNSHIPNAQLGLDVLYNIIFMLAAFLASEKVKAYSMFWSFGVIVLGLAQAARVLWLPRQYFLAGQMTQTWFTVFSVLLGVSGLMLVVAGIIGIIRSSMLRIHLRKQGGIA